MSILDLQNLQVEAVESAFDAEAKSCSSCNEGSCHLKGDDFANQMSQSDISWVND